MRNLLSHNELDKALDPSADEPARFEPLARELLKRVELTDMDLEISDPSSWRSARAKPRTSFLEQFRADVDTIYPLDRRAEGQLARRIEFARMRFEGVQAREPAHSPRLMRSATELHSLRSEMVERNLYLVLINVERYTHAHSSRMDLIQEGCCSLFRAVDGFDWRRGLLFRTYAVHWLNQAFRNYLYNHTHTVRVPVYLQKAMKGIHQAAGRIGDARAAPRQLAEHSDLSEGLIASAIKAARTTYSLDADRADEGARLRDLLVDNASSGTYHPEFEDVSLIRGLGRALGEIGEREQLVVRMRFGIGYDREYTLAEVAEKLGVSVERVRQIQVRALDKLDTPTLRRQLEPFLN